MKFKDPVKDKSDNIVEQRPCPHCGCIYWFNGAAQFVCVDCGRAHDKRKNDEPKELDFNG
jgi:uncharacterized Zn ribbon protein